MTGWFLSFFFLSILNSKETDEGMTGAAITEDITEYFRFKLSLIIMAFKKYKKTFLS